MKGNHDSDILTVIQSPSGLTFATKKSWKKINKEDLFLLHGYSIIGNTVTVGSVYFMLKNMNPTSWMHNREELLLLKITVDEETGKIDFFGMALSSDEARQILDNPFTLWGD